MGWIRFGLAVVFWGGVAAACSSTKAAPHGGDDASSADDASEAPSTDGSAVDAEPSHDGSVVDASSHGTDASDSTVEICPPEKFPKWDGSFPDTGCGLPSLDSDGDGYPDCDDGCPNDPDKIAPGVCGCGVSDQDSDGDRVPDCLDDCPLDPNNTSDYSQCGCAGGVNLPPAGTPCTDTGCPQTGAVCNGAGVCGDRSACSPCPGGRLVMSKDLSTQFWFCAALPQVPGPTCTLEDAGTIPPPATRAAAESACAAKGIALARIETLSEDWDLYPLLTGTTWIGANDLQTPGQWYWPSATSESDSLFWSGGLDGSQQNSEFDYWVSGAPGSQSCATVSPVTGQWSDTDCSETLGYLCSYDPPLL